MKQSLEELKNSCKNCSSCNLACQRNNVVFGSGDINADILLIGEAPGANEDLTGEPFVGKSGKLLDVILDTVGLNRNDNIYIANIVKCRPPKNRNPLKGESSACIHWLESQIEIIKPKLIVCLGKVPSSIFIKKDIKVLTEHGQIFKRDDIVYMPTVHPSAILMNKNLMPIAIEDFKKCCNLIKND